MDVEYHEIIPKKFITTHAYKYLWCCLIATNDPLKYVRDNLYETVDKLKEKIKIKNIDKEYSIYLDKYKEYNDKIEKIRSKYSSEDIID